MNKCTSISNFVTIEGVTDIPIAEPMPNISTVTVAGSDVQHSFLISVKSPINLMGQDLLCNLNAIIHRTPDGLFLTIRDDKTLQIFPFFQSTNDFLCYWILPHGSVGRLNGDGMTNLFT